MGKELRRQVPRSSLGDWSAPAARPDPVRLIMASHVGRLDWLIPVRVGRMAASPYGFMRGAAIVMAEDVARLPSTGITPVICGDSHMGNFGFYASPEQDLVIDLNDFDEAHPGGWEWDLRRLVASIWVAGRQNGASERECESAVLRCVAGYREEVRDLASTALLTRSYQRLDVDHLHQSTKDKSLRAEIKRAAGRARRRTSDRALPKFTSERDGKRRIVEDAPLITRVSYAEADEVARGLDDYLGTLAPHWRRALGGYTLIDVAHKVVGVGSVGLRAYVALLEGSSPDDVVFLQLKQARRSVLARYVHGESAWHAHQGQRVVEYQQALQTVSDPLLGWTTVDGLQYYVRQFRNMKGTIPLDAIDAAALTDYAGPEIEAMRLSGDVRIDVIGIGKPIQIKADRVVLELTADDAVQRKGSLPLTGSRQLHSTRVIEDGDATQTFVGNVVFTLQTASGALQIRADRVEHTERLGVRMEPRAGV